MKKTSPIQYSSGNHNSYKSKSLVHLLVGHLTPFGNYLLAQVAQLLRLATFVPLDYPLQLLGTHEMLALDVEGKQDLEDPFPQGDTRLDEFSVIPHANLREPFL